MQAHASLLLAASVAANSRLTVWTHVDYILARFDAERQEKTTTTEPKINVHVDVHTWRERRYKILNMGLMETTHVTSYNSHR